MHRLWKNEIPRSLLSRSRAPQAGLQRLLASALQEETPVTDQLLTRKEVLARCGISRQTVDRLEAKGLFPKRTRLGEGQFARVVWSQTEVDAWIEERLTKRPPPTPDQMLALAHAPRATKRERSPLPPSVSGIGPRHAYVPTPLEEMEIKERNERLRLSERDDRTLPRAGRGGRGRGGRRKFPGAYHYKAALQRAGLPTGEL